MSTMKTVMSVVMVAAIGMSAGADARERVRGDGADRRQSPAGQGPARNSSDRRADRADDRAADAEARLRTNRPDGAGAAHRGDRRTAHYESRVDNRQAMQRARIRQGVRAGQVTPREARRLRQSQRQIARMEHRFGADGRFTRIERHKLNRALARSSRQIQRSRHDTHGRPPARWFWSHRGRI